MTRHTVLVLGANGRFGRAATDAFAAAGWHVLAQVRRAPARPLPPGATALALPLAGTDALVQAAAGAVAVVHAVNPLYTAWDRELMPAARQGMDVAQRLGALFMLPGNVYNFGEGMPALLRESTPERPTTAKGRQRAALEAELAARAPQGLRSVVLRAGDFFGAGTGSWLDLMIAKSLPKGRVVYPGPLDVPHAWAYLPDLARAFVAVAERRAALAPAARLHFAGHTLTGTQFLDALERAALAVGAAPAGRLLQRRRMAWWPLRVGGLVVPMLRELSRMAYLWHVPHALDGAALEQCIGPQANTPIDDALRQALVGLGFGGRTATTAALAA